jgi:hypothetical protein
LNESREIVYQNALTKYKELLDKGDITKKNYFEQRAREIEENKRLEE